MSYTKVVIQRLISPDGKVIAEAKSTVSISGGSESTVNQSVTVKVSSSNSCSSSSSSSSSASSR